MLEGGTGGEFIGCVAGFCTLGPAGDRNLSLVTPWSGASSDEGDICEAYMG